MMDLGVAFQALELVASQPGFNLLQTIRDLSALKSLVDAIKGAGKLDLPSLQHAGLVGPAIDATARLAPMLAKVKDDPHVGAQVMSMLASLG